MMPNTTGERVILVDPAGRAIVTEKPKPVKGGGVAMAEQQDEQKGKKGEKDEKEKKQSPPTLTLIPGQVTRDRKLPVAAFVKGTVIEGEVQFYVGQDYRPAGRPVGIDPQGMATTLMDIPSTATGMLYVSAKTKGMTSPVGQNVEIPELEQPKVVQKFKIVDTGPTYDANGYAHMLWTVRAFDDTNRSADATLHVVGARSFVIVGHGGKRRVFDIEIPRKGIKTLELIVFDPGLLEVDAQIDEVDVELEDRALPGAKKIPGPGACERIYLGFTSKKKNRRKP